MATYAGIPLPTRNGGADYRREIERKRQERERIDRSVEYLADMERELRLECRDKIHECDRILAKPGPWDEWQWQRARVAFVLRDEFLLPQYSMLSFGTAEARAKYVLAHHTVRAEMATAIRVAGGVQADDGHFVEVIGT